MRFFCCFALLALALVAGCRTNPAAPTGAGNHSTMCAGNVFGAAADDDVHAGTDTADVYVDVTRHWHPEDSIVHLFGNPDPEPVSEWKAACEKNELHRIDSLELSRFAEGVPHLTAFYDLNNLSFMGHDEDAFVCWRLAQFTGDSIVPASLQGKLELFRRQIERLLDFDAAFQAELNMKAGMESYLQNCYNRIAVLQFAQRADSSLAMIAMRDFAFAERYTQAYDSTFEVVNYYDGMASSYPVERGESQTYEVMMYRCAVNAWVCPDSTRFLGNGSRYATIPLVLAEYDAFIKGLEEGELELPVAQRREALRKEKVAWKKWMDLRIEMAPKLPEPYRSAFDHATRSICRRKLITLKNRYDCFGYRSDDSFSALLPFDCTDQELATYGRSVEGIVPDFSPYYYDPAWHIHYSENGRVLLYFPRDSSATHFIIPSEVQAIGDRAFMCNQHLTELTLHDNIRKISVCAFHACAELRSIAIQGPLTEIPWRAFDGCPKLETVDLPASIESIAGFAFAGCTKLRKLIVRSPEPPVFQMDNSEPGVTDFDWAFNDTRLSDCILYVPALSISKYQNAIGWNRFKHIQAI